MTSVWVTREQNSVDQFSSLCSEDFDGLTLEHKYQGAAYREQQCGEGGAVLVRLAFQCFLVGLVGGGGALGHRHGAGWQGGAASAHVVKVPGKLCLPGLLS